MRSRSAVLILALACSAGCATAAPVTAGDALALAKKMCAPLATDAATPVQWKVTESDEIHNIWKGPGDYWLADGQYYPKTSPGVISVIDLLLFVPKDGTPPKPCTGVSN